VVALALVLAGDDVREEDGPEEGQMKIAITATTPDLTGRLDVRFGRARYLLLVDTSSHSVEAVDNSAGKSAAQGAGIQAAQTVIDGGASALITGNCGPKAFRALEAAGISVFLAEEGSLTEVLDKFERGELKPSAAANVGGHW